MTDKQSNLRSRGFDKYCPRCGDPMTEDNTSNLFGEEVCQSCFGEDIRNGVDREYQ